MTDRRIPMENEIELSQKTVKNAYRNFGQKNLFWQLLAGLGNFYFRGEKILVVRVKRKIT